MYLLILTVGLGEDDFAGIQATTHELIVHGHWHGVGYSGEYEWGSFLLADQSLKRTAYIDAVGDIHGLSKWLLYKRHERRV